jgi:hypothetical protein
MNTIAALPLASCAVPTPFPARRRSPWRWILITLGGLTTLAAVFFITLLLSFRMGGEARALRQAVLAATPGEWAPRFEFGVGRLPAWLARAGFHLAEGKLNLPPEARFGIDAFRSADIGVYRRHHASSQDSSSTILAKVDSSMAAQDWESIVSVQDAQHNVRIFVPKNLSDLRATQACVFVMENDELVIVSARLNLEPLVELASSKLHCSPFPR